MFNRWGRMGHHGQWQLTPYKTFEEADKNFRSIFLSKTGNNWSERN